MIADDGKTPILMDFGSTMKARVSIENRSQALLQQVRPVFKRDFHASHISFLHRILLQNRVQWPIAHLNCLT